MVDEEVDVDAERLERHTDIFAKEIILMTYANVRKKPYTCSPSVESALATANPISEASPVITTTLEFNISLMPTQASRTANDK